MILQLHLYDGGVSGLQVVYLFLEQISWLIRAGLVSKRLSPRVTRISAWAELIGESVVCATRQMVMPGLYSEMSSWCCMLLSQGTLAA